MFVNHLLAIEYDSISPYMNVVMSYWGFCAFLNFVVLMLWFRKFVKRYSAHNYDFDKEVSPDQIFIFFIPFYNIFVVIKYSLRFVKKMGASWKEVIPILAIVGFQILTIAFAISFAFMPLIFVSGLSQIGEYVLMEYVFRKHYVEPDRRIHEDE